MQIKEFSKGLTEPQVTKSKASGIKRQPIVHVASDGEDEDEEDQPVLTQYDKHLSKKKARAKRKKWCNRRKERRDISSDKLFTCGGRCASPERSISQFSQYFGILLNTLLVLLKVNLVGFCFSCSDQHGLFSIGTHFNISLTD